MIDRTEVDRCTYQQGRFDIVWVDSHSAGNDEEVHKQCLRPEGHEGPHLIIDHFGQYVAWEYDKQCQCEDCRSEDPHDWCLVFWRLNHEDGVWLEHSIRPIYQGTPEERNKIGEGVLMSVDLATRRDHHGQYFYCNVQDRTYVIAADHNAAGKAYRKDRFLPSEGWSIYGVTIQNRHL